MLDFALSDRQILTVDLHQMNTAQAKDWLYARVTAAPKEIREIHVIHGYHGGTALQNMVRRSFRHPRVKSKVLGLNQGTTILVLRQGPGDSR